MTVIRPARPGDCDPVRRFLDGLSPTSRHQRFFSELPKVTDALIQILVGDNALLAWDGDVVIGHGMAAPVTQDGDGGMAASVDNAVDVGVVVAEAYRRQGVGGRLVRELTIDAKHIRCDVLCGNYFVLRWLRRLMPEMRVERAGDTITVHGSRPRPLTYKDYVITQWPAPVDRG
ncbi:GNAT family N-acetyltransferase [Kutzneria sp. NPDC051319]|uniref:GNAT family N-acetyltransferase n=1 Tax=Kutzneria sp. NPDC051319 TaxID=3155047 RepID=UPI003434450F